MNIQESDILYWLIQEPFANQRILSEITKHSIGVVNRSLKYLVKEGFIDEENKPTKKAYDEFEKTSPKNAIILAAGLGIRMVPINTHTPKALMKVRGEVLIERIIKHLHEVQIKDIYIVVGFMKELFEYLIDDYGVQLIVNEEYSTKNNLHSLFLASSYLSNTYVVPCDIWCEKNLFREKELYSWYMVSDFIDDQSSVRVNRKMELATIGMNQAGNAMVGISYLVGEQSEIIKDTLRLFEKECKYDNSFWEETLVNKTKFIVPARIVPSSEITEINTYEQLRELDEQSLHLKSNAIASIAKVFDVELKDVINIQVLKKGMTNRSFMFTCNEKKYIMRIPGEGTEQLINRNGEASVYKVIAGDSICDDIVYINPNSGYKIAEFIKCARVCDPYNEDDIIACMKKLREFHAKKISVEHEFNLFKQLNFYESLWNGTPSIYKDYIKTKDKVFELKKYIDDTIGEGERTLTHIDAVPDNFLFTQNGEVRLIDWEYAGMQDPHVDIAMFCIYSLYDKEKVDRLIHIYFEGECPEKVRIKIYCYIAVCGLMWSNWCEYKRNLGIEFGEYSLRQYRYAKEYYKIVNEEINENA